MHERMDAAGAVDAQNAPTAPWKTAQNAVSHSAHTHHRFTMKKNGTNTVNPLYTRNSGQSPSIERSIVTSCAARRVISRNDVCRDLATLEGWQPWLLPTANVSDQ